MIDKFYLQFCKELNKEKIEWCFIKDFFYLLEKKYDNEIDLIAHKKDRSKLRSLARKLGWRESTHNTFNTHLIFWRFSKGVPYRIDIHLGVALATAAPYISATSLLKTRKKKGSLYYAAEAYELAILVLCACRGRDEIKKHRTKRLKELLKRKEEARGILSKIGDKAFENYFENMLKGKVFKVPFKKRLGTIGMTKYQLLQMELFANRMIKPSKVFRVKATNKKTLLKMFENSKLKVKVFPTNTSSMILYKARLLNDIILVMDRTSGILTTNKEKFLDHIYKNIPL